MLDPNLAATIFITLYGLVILYGIARVIHMRVTADKDTQRHLRIVRAEDNERKFKTKEGRNI